MTDQTEKTQIALHIRHDIGAGTRAAVEAAAARLARQLAPARIQVVDDENGATSWFEADTNAERPPWIVFKRGGEAITGLTAHQVDDLVRLDLLAGRPQVRSVRNVPGDHRYTRDAWARARELEL